MVTAGVTKPTRMLVAAAASEAALREAAVRVNQ
jgi:hypothetical protein